MVFKPIIRFGQEGVSSAQARYTEHPMMPLKIALSADESPGDELVLKLKLDVKALTLLYESDTKLGGLLQKTFVESRDDHMVRFLSLLQPRRRTGRSGTLLVALGEIILASFLTIIGIAAFVPTVIGLSTPQQFSDYLSRTFIPAFGKGAFDSGITILEFVFSALLMLGAFYTLRHASQSLKDAGLRLETSGQ